MDTITFINPGLIDLKTITTFGVSVKENESPIGYFGTGLKYALAVLLRTGHNVTLHRGKKKHTFHLERTKIRKKGFQVIHMDGSPLPFTTELGKNWEPWMAYRELVSNAMDEGGQVHHKALDPRAHHTVIKVTGPSTSAMIEQHKSIFLETEPLYRGSKINIHPGHSHYLYYRGVRVHELQNPSIYTYNLTGVQSLTEDRTLASVWGAKYDIKQELPLINDKDLLRKIVAPGCQTQETRLDFSEVSHFSPALIELCDEYANDYGEGVNRSLVRAVQDKLKLRRAKEAPKDLSSLNRKILDRAVRFCNRISYPVDRYPIHVVDSLGNNIFGLAKDKEIFLSIECFGMGTAFVASTLIEEYLHLDRGWLDGDREMQNHLFNKIVSLGQEAIGEPL